MSKKGHLKIFVNGAGYDAIGYQIAPVFFGLEKPNHEKMFFPWSAIDHVRLDARWAKVEQAQAKQRAKQQMEEEERQRKALEEKIAAGPQILRPPGGLITPR